MPVNSIVPDDDLANLYASDTDLTSSTLLPKNGAVIVARAADINFFNSSEFVKNSFVVIIFLLFVPN